VELPKQVYRSLPRRQPKEWRFSRYALRFVDLDDCIRVLHNLSLAIGGDFTILAWVYRMGTGGGEGWIVNKGWNYTLECGANWGNDLTFRFYDGTAWQLFDSGILVPLRKWTHVGVVWKDAELKAELYMNGLLVGEKAFTSDPDETYTGDLYIGGHPTFTGAHVYGMICCAQVFNIAFSARRVFEEAVRGYAKVVGGCVLNLDMEEGTGLVVRDGSPYANNGDLLPTADPPIWREVELYQLLSEAGL